MIFTNHEHEELKESTAANAREAREAVLNKQQAAVYSTASSTVVGAEKVSCGTNTTPKKPAHPLVNLDSHLKSKTV